MDEKRALLDQEQGKKLVVQQLRVSTTCTSSDLLEVLCILSLPSLHSFHSFLSSRPSFTLSLLSLKQGSLPQLITEIDLICLLQRRHMLRCVSQPTNDETYVCFMCFLYSIRRLKRKITLTFLCFSSSWLL